MQYSTMNLISTLTLLKRHLLCVVLGLGSLQAHAELVVCNEEGIYSVDNLTDLRAAVDCGNDNGSATISLATGTYDFSADGLGDIGVAGAISITGSSPEDTILDGNEATRHFYVASGGNLTLEQLTLQNGYDSYGGAVYGGSSSTINITNSTLSENTASIGGGVISVYASDEITIVNISGSTFSGNTAERGGVVSVSASTDASDGTAIVNISNSTFDGNTASISGGVVESSYNSTVNIFNSTLNNNTAHIGGAVYAYDDDTINVSSSTFSGNTASYGAAVYAAYPTSRVNLRSSIFSQSNSCYSYYDAAINSDGYNIATDSSCVLTSEGDLQNTDPMLDELADNGGPTMTHALLEGSSAIDAGSCTDIEGNNVTADQRGVARVDDAGQPTQDGNQDGVAQCDIGAYEYDPTIYDLSVNLYAGSKDQPITTVTANQDYSYQVWTSVNGNDSDEYAAWGINQIFTLPTVEGVPLEVIGISSSGECTAYKEYISCDFISLDGESSLITTVTVKAPSQSGAVLSSAAEVWYDANLYEQQDGQAVTEANSENNLSANSVTVVGTGAATSACNRKSPRCNNNSSSKKGTFPFLE